ncbi:MAG: hypothetical protein COB67_10415 [SAR324 cluster bacterium]|uniref:AAA+ ATPase domain-containing protein n=1 Tax=SAR324 cluster bacterium TaxID=2024889 RepID=A0A2A4SXM7_9DELT|nr:MAG: hypothetical protein COB67_10415 [SAR324 cluster bacterium]
MSKPSDYFEKICLRPKFTRNLLKRLYQKRTINLFGAAGTGKKRLVADLKGNPLSNLKIVTIRFEGYSKDYEGFFQNLCQAADIEPHEKIKGINHIFEKLAAKHERVIFILDDFERFLKPIQDPGYLDFHNQLNALRGIQKLSILLVTQEPIGKRMVEIAGKRYESIIASEEVRLPPLSQDVIEKEIERISLNKNIQFMERAKIAIYIDQKPCPYERLKYYMSYLNDDQGLCGEDLNSMLEKLDGQF